MAWFLITRSEVSLRLAHSSARYFGYSSAKCLRIFGSARMALIMKWLTSSSSVCTIASAARRLASVIVGLRKGRRKIRLMMAS
ncbi:hypothetical protein D3C79_911110 [compost metagenome]